MSTLHNQLYANLLATVLYSHLSCFEDGERNMVYEGDDLPEDMYEPYMRVEIKAVWVEEPLGRLLKIHFLGGVKDAPFQETVFTLFPNLPTGVLIAHPIPHLEFSLCSMFNYIAHWCVDLMGEREGLPSCCCPDRTDDQGHNESCTMPDYSVNDNVVTPAPVSKPVTTGEVLEFKPRLRSVPNEPPRN